MLQLHVIPVMSCERAKCVTQITYLGPLPMVLPTIALELDDHYQAREQSYAQEQKSLPLQKFLGEQEMFVQD